MAFAESGAPQVEIAEDHWQRIGSAPIRGLAAAFVSQPSGLHLGAIYSPSIDSSGILDSVRSSGVEETQRLGLRTPVLSLLEPARII